MEKMPVGVFTSIGAGLGASLDAVKQLGVRTVHLHAPHGDMRSPEKAADIRRQFAEAGITVTVVFCGFEGESYETIPSVQQTIGLVPRATRAVRLKETLEISDFAKVLGVDIVAMHLGAVPEDPKDPEYPGIVEATRLVCEYCQRNGQRFHLETGQETADALLHFIGAVGRDNLAINFDPANMILYGAGEPISALKKVNQYVKSVHCKDAKNTRGPGQKWYEDCALGTGDVGMETFIRTLKGLGYEGPLTIEREYSADQAGDLAEAVRLLERLRGV